MFVIKKIT